MHPKWGPLAKCSCMQGSAMHPKGLQRCAVPPAGQPPWVSPPSRICQVSLEELLDAADPHNFVGVFTYVCGSRASRQRGAAACGPALECHAAQSTSVAAHYC
jgi:hypothetical protein